MVPFRFRIHVALLCAASSCLVLTSTGCEPPRSQAITTEDGQVATDFSADMIDEGTPVTADQPETPAETPAE